LFRGLTVTSFGVLFADSKQTYVALPPETGQLAYVHLPAEQPPQFQHQHGTVYDDFTKMLAVANQPNGEYALHAPRPGTDYVNFN
jgi:hypothetical protein